jgi:hypothetical protein
MSFNGLSDRDGEAVLQCIRAIAEGQLIEDWEIQARIGLDRKTLRMIISEWPNVDDSVVNSHVYLAVNNCMNEICHGVQIPQEDWEKWFTVTRSQVLESYLKWSDRRGHES